jgi:EAL domain-containing protein (putative c-di-GMP-specific phosphodiesterase class I)
MLEIMHSGGEYGQGFYFGKAMPAAEASQLVRRIAIDSRTRKKKA